MPSDAWKWGEADESLVVPSVQAVAVYTNPKGDIVIRQQDSMGDQDSVIVIPRKMADQVSKAIRAESKKEFTPD